jgi:E3 ubiquitin-protein ligase UBR4
MHLIPYLVHTALYVLNTTRVAMKEGAAVDKFLLQPPTLWKEDFGATDGPYYYLVVSLMVQSPTRYLLLLRFENRIEICIK